ncbi:MAG: membrane integrity-associated transporter subunit PqiC [Alphaproteobacteria bacterium]|nr:membrane integrity-associated transporter subunit PqiC [Alphaproteobacteria bacterium]
MRRARPVVAATALIVAACAAGPPPKTYVLGAAPAVVDTAAPLPGRPVLEVRRVLVPDYLDGTDIVSRGPGNLVEPSRTGRWGERLSLGVTHAVAAALSRRLPEVVITTNPPPEGAACQLLLDVQVFEADTDGRVAFVAQWRILAATSGDTLAGEQASFTEPIAGMGDEPVVAAMSTAVDKLADRVAISVRRLGAPCHNSGTSAASSRS